MQKLVFLTSNSIWVFMKLHGFHSNSLCDFKECGCTCKNTHISAATPHRTLNLVSNQLQDIARSLCDRICKLSNLNIH